jgi:fucose permease
MEGEWTAVRRREVLAVNAAGIVQGLALVTFPAASAVFTSPRDYGLSSTAYGGMFLPQAVMAIVASLLGAGLIRRLGVKRIYLLGLAADLLAMILLFSSQFMMAHRSMAYGMLLLATTSLGIGFGLTVPALNTFTAAFFPRRIDSAVLMLNALLGVGTALAPVLVAIFIHIGIWWGLPVLVAALVFALLLSSLPLPLQTRTVGGRAQGRDGGTGLPSRFWVFAAFALVYGMLETLSGNWAAIYMSRSLGATTLAASLALTVFWGMVTAGRLLFAGIAKWLPEYRAHRLLPLVIAAAFGAIAWLPKGDSILGILAFGLAGLGCSALLPLTISFGQGEMTAIAASVAGGLIAFYQLGYGMTAFGIGPLQEHAGLSLDAVFGFAAVAALVLTALSFVIGRHDASALSRLPRGA